MLLMTASSANAGALTHRLSSSVQLTVDAAATNVTRLGSTFSISGNGVDTTDGTTVNTISTGAITSGVYAPGTITATQDTPGNAFSFSQSYTQGDAIPSAAVTVGEVANFGNIWRYSNYRIDSVYTFIFRLIFKMKSFYLSFKFSFFFF